MHFFVQKKFLLSLPRSQSPPHNLITHPTKEPTMARTKSLGKKAPRIQLATKRVREEEPEFMCLLCCEENLGPKLRCCTECQYTICDDCHGTLASQYNSSDIRRHVQCPACKHPSPFPSKSEYQKQIFFKTKRMKGAWRGVLQCNTTFLTETIDRTDLIKLYEHSWKIDPKRLETFTYESLLAFAPTISGSLFPKIKELAQLATICHCSVCKHDDCTLGNIPVKISNGRLLCELHGQGKPHDPSEDRDKIAFHTMERISPLREDISCFARDLHLYHEEDGVFQGDPTIDGIDGDRLASGYAEFGPSPHSPGWLAPARNHD